MLEMSMSKAKDREIICKNYFFSFHLQKCNNAITFILKTKENPKLYLRKCKMFYHQLKSIITSSSKVENVLLTRSASL